MIFHHIKEGNYQFFIRDSDNIIQIFAKVAALKHLDVKKKKVVAILSGGNMDVITMS